MNLEDLASKFRNVKWNGSDKFQASCPAHEDAKASLAVRQMADRQVMHCFAGCTFDAITGAVGLSKSEFFNGNTNGHRNGTALAAVERPKAAEFVGPTTTTRFAIKDIDGSVFAVHCREDGQDAGGNRSKRMWWETPDGKPGLGGIKAANLPLFGTEMLRNEDAETTVVVVEGEKAARSLVRRGIVAVGTACGASATPSAHVLQCLKPFRDVVLWPDNDDAGRKHMHNLSVTLQGIGAQWRTLTWADAPLKGDAADFEGNQDALLGLLGSAAREGLNLPAVQPDAQLPDVISIDWEDHASALIANEEYLTHVPIIEGLCYAKTASLLVGGKHSGKTTNARTIALSVCRGLTIFGRQTTQGPVLYCASEDEVLVVRSELLRMGWNPGDPLNLMKIGSKTLADPNRLLDAIAEYASSRRAVLIILDMLFDFAGIKDEMSYAGTREAAGKVYDLAMRTDAHVIATHHSPKYMSGGATAETAALGSQGIAARFSPIILSRHWGGDLYTIESTPPRDPRGKGLEAVCITLDDNGMSRAGEKFADSMRWRVMAPKVLDFISSVDPGQHHTVSALSEGMEINRPMMQTILFNLCREGKLHREKKGRSYKYFLPPAQDRLWQPEN